MSLREITFADSAEHLLTHPAVEGLIGLIEGDHEYVTLALYPDNHNFDQTAVLGEFLTSDSYYDLSDSDRAVVARAVNIAMRDESQSRWWIEGEPAPDNLLGLPDVVAEVPCIEGDSMITTGAVMLDIDRLQPDFWKDNPEFAGQRVGFANFIGANLVARDQDDAKRNALRYSIGPFIDEQVVIGGDFHGDFRMTQASIYLHGSIDPTGTPVSYAPIGNQRGVAGYHSVEPMLLVDALKHLHATGLSDEEQKEIVRAAILEFTNQANEKDDSPFSGHFGDYGAQDIEYFLNEMEFFFTDAKYQKTATGREVWSSDRVSPSGRSHLNVKTVEGQLVFANAYEKDGEIHESSQAAVRIPTAQIGPFITALLHQTYYGMGRSSPKGLLAILESRLSTTVA